MNLSLPPPQTAVNHYPAVNVQATIASETPNASSQIIVTGLAATLSGTAASGSVRAVLRDGPTGSGTIRASFGMTIPAGGNAQVFLSGLSIAMTPGNVATLEFDAAGGASTQEAVTLIYTTNARLG